MIAVKISPYKCSPKHFLVLYDKEGDDDDNDENDDNTKILKVFDSGFQIPNAELRLLEYSWFTMLC